MEICVSYRNGIGEIVISAGSAAIEVGVIGPAELGQLAAILAGAAAELSEYAYDEAQKLERDAAEMRSIRRKEAAA